MIVFEQLDVQGFCPFTEHQTIFLNKPSMLVLGHNTTATSAESNGVGKSSLYKALAWCLYGETADGDTGDDVVNKHSKQAVVKLHIKDNTNDIYIERSRGKGQTDATLQILDSKGTTINEVTGHKQTVEAVEKLLGMDWQTFKNTTMYCQGDYKRFADPNTTDAERKSILRRILNLDVMSDCAVVARKRVSSIKTELAEWNVKMSGISSNISTLELDIDLSQGKVKDWEYKHQLHINEINTQLDTLASQAVEPLSIDVKATSAQTSVSKSVAQLEIANKQLLEAKKVHEQLRDEHTVLVRDQASKETQLHGLNDRLHQLTGERCPTCNSPLSVGEAKDYKEQLYKQIKEQCAVLRIIDNDMVVKRQEIEASNVVLDSINTDIKDCQALHNKAIGLLHKYQSDIKVNNQLISEIVRLKKQLNETRAEKCPHTGNTTQLEQRLREHKRLRSQAQSKIKELSDRLRLTEFWVDAYGNEGLINWAILQVLPTLESSANQYLGLLTDGSITLELDTRSKLKSGKAVDKLGFKLNIENLGDVTPSGGQAKRISLAVSLALMSLVRARTGASIANLFLDEPDVGLDTAGKERFYGPLLNTLKGQYGCVTVITHDPNVRGYFDDTIFIKRAGGKSWVE